MDIDTDWNIVKKIFKQSFLSSFHFSIATVDVSGKPHVTPIGSLILDKPGHAIYFEEFTSKLQNNLKTSKYVSVLAVNSSKLFWIKSLILGHFTQLPALRLHGEAGVLREATENEIQLWQKRVNPLRFTKGHEILWKNMKMVREINFTKVDPVSIGSMTAKF